MSLPRELPINKFMILGGVIKALVNDLTVFPALHGNLIVRHFAPFRVGIV